MFWSKFWPFFPHLGRLWSPLCTLCTVKKVLQLIVLLCYNLFFVYELLGFFVFCFPGFISGVLLTPTPNIFDNIVEREEREEEGVTPVALPSIINNILKGEEGKEREAYEFGAAGAVEPKSVGIELKEGEVSVVCGLLFIEYIFAPLFGGVLPTIIGRFAAPFAAILSNFSGVIVDIIDYINGYKFAAIFTAYSPNDICLFEGLVGTYFIIVYGFIVGLLSSIYGLIAGFYGYDFTPAIGANTTHNNAFNGNDNQALVISATGLDKGLIDRICYPLIGGLKTIIIIGYLAALTATTTTATTEIGY